MASSSLQLGLECQAGKLCIPIFDPFARRSTRQSGSLLSEVVVVVNPGLQTGAYLGGEPLGHGPPFGSPGLQNCIEK